MGAASWEREASESDTTLEENWLFRLRRERYRSRASGLGHDFYVLELADAVHVIALTPLRRVVLVRQFRAGSKEDSLETPGGLLEPGENPLVAGARELAEETGFEGDPPILLGTVWSNPSIMSSRITTILIPNARPTAAVKLDHAEEVDVALVPAADIPRMIADGRINHALSVAGLLWWLIAEMPGTALSVAGLAKPGSRWSRLRIATVMGIVAAAALILGVAKSLAGKDPAAMVAAVMVFMLFSLGFLAILWLSKPHHSTLIRLVEGAHRGRNSLLWYLAIIGLFNSLLFISFLIITICEGAWM
ncbi:MAG TPA: NUDIX hydrolase [Isosphaeraceae bacterium]|jgi:8-oxo-dGTP pyrophosphatase MutT (NUDIX family)|nr:NUDIX hydrolase [Isosphaeraceae bacterium]